MGTDLNDALEWALEAVADEVCQMAAQKWLRENHPRWDSLFIHKQQDRVNVLGYVLESTATFQAQSNFTIDSLREHLRELVSLAESDKLGDLSDFVTAELIKELDDVL